MGPPQLGTIPSTFVPHHTSCFPLTAPSLPSIRLDRPCFVMTASCESPVRTYERFTVTYTLLNNLQDFLAVRLVWTPEHAQAGRSTARLWDLILKARRGKEEVMGVTGLWQTASALYRDGLHMVIDGEFGEAVKQVMLRTLTWVLGSLVCLISVSVSAIY